MTAQEKAIELREKGLTFKEIAKTLGVSETTAKRYCKKAQNDFPKETTTTDERPVVSVDVQETNECGDNGGVAVEVMNEAIVNAMISFMKEHKGNLTVGTKKEFIPFVKNGVEETAEYFLFTELGMLHRAEIQLHVTEVAGDFYDEFYKKGKKYIIEILNKHLTSGGSDE